MNTWATLTAGAPEIATIGRQLLERTGSGRGLLATVRGDTPPRIHPVSVAIHEGSLLTFVVVGSAKLGDLVADGRYALHALHDPAQPDEFLIRGRAVEVTDPERRADAAAAWTFEVDDGYRLFELAVDHAIVGRRASPDDWPPAYTSWRATAD
jgi:pyridoxamine 5'-phosphate oxidase-like protein